MQASRALVTTRVRNRCRSLAVAGLVLALVATGQALSASELDPVSFELSLPVLQTLGKLQEEWLNWLAAYYRGDEEEAKIALESLLAGARDIGMARLPELSLGATAAAVRLAAQEDFELAQEGLRAARQLDPTLPDVEFGAAQVAWLDGAYFGAVSHWFAGYVRLSGAPLKRQLWLTDLAICLLSALLLTGVAFVIVEMATRGPHLLRDLLGLLTSFMPLFLAYVVAVGFLIWPILLPSGPLLLVIYWSLLIFGYGSWSERAVLIGLWLLVAAAPVVVSELRQQVEKALSPEIRTLENLRSGLLSGALFSDVAALRAALPESVAVTHLLGDLNLRLRQWETALDLYTEVLKAEPDNPFALCNTGVCYFNRGDLDEAIEYFRRATDLPEASAAAYFNLSQTYSEIYRFEDAGRALRVAQEIDNEAVGDWLVSAASERVVALGGGIGRAEEIRGELFGGESGDGPEQIWGPLDRRLFPLAVAFALATGGIHLLRKRGSRRKTPPMPWWHGSLDVVRRALLPGLAEAEDGRFLSAYLALLVPVTLVTLPLLGHFGYAVPWGFGPSRSAYWLLAGIGLVVYFGLRVARQVRDRP